MSIETVLCLSMVLFLKFGAKLDTSLHFLKLSNLSFCGFSNEKSRNKKHFLCFLVKPAVASISICPLCLLASLGYNMES